MIKAIAFDFVGVFVKENDFELTPVQEVMERKFGVLNTDKQFLDWCKNETGLSQKEIETSVKFIISHIYDIREPDIFLKLPKLKFSTATNHLSYLDIWFKTLEISKQFDYFVNSANIGFEKPNLDFYKTLTKTIGENSSEILFIDDNYDNCIGGEKAGLQILHFKKGMILSKEILRTIGDNLN